MAVIIIRMVCNVGGLCRGLVMNKLVKLKGVCPLKLTGIQLKYRTINRVKITQHGQIQVIGLGDQSEMNIANSAI